MSPSFSEVTTAQGAFMQVPFGISAIAFFHSVPSSFGDIELDGCTLAKIFNRDITRWNDPAIKTLNPNTAEIDHPITVVRRVEGSSSTSLSTEYLNVVCSSVWPDTIVGSTITWKTDTVGRQGSGGVSGYLAANPYSIGYIDSGHGIAEGLNEISLINKAEKWLKPSAENVISDAASIAAGTNRSAAEYTKSWSNVTLMNQPGENSWPICTFSYMYIKKDLTGTTSPEEIKSAALIKAFAQYVLSEEAQAMLPEFGFVPLPAGILAQARLAVNLIDPPNNAPDWKFEKDTNKLLNMTTGLTKTTFNGQGEFVFSGKRMAYADYERTALAGTVEALSAKVATLETEQAKIAPGAWYDDPKKQIEAAAAVGALGFIFGFVGLVLGAVAMTRVKGLSKSGGYQI